MKDKHTKTVTFAELPTWMQSGDTLEAFDSSGRRRGEYKVTSISTGKTATVRGLRWHERVWLTVKVWVRRRVLGVTIEDDIRGFVAAIKKALGIK